MNRYLAKFLAGLTKLYDHYRGERTFNLLEVNSSPHEVYRMITSNGGEVVLYCTETVYEIVFTNWWVRDRRFHNYCVYGHCDSRIPQEFSDRIRTGFNIGRLLPRFASRREQKKAAIHAYISLIVSELGENKKP
jgi:hypothetical protein